MDRSIQKISSSVIGDIIDNVLPAAKELSFVNALYWFRLYSFLNRQAYRIKTDVDDINYLDKIINDFTSIGCQYVGYETDYNTKKFNFVVVYTESKVQDLKDLYPGFTYVDEGSAEAVEPNMGFISKDLTLKEWAKKLYKQFTGKTNTTEFENVIANLNRN